jgi:hypothetical protein
VSGTAPGRRRTASQARILDNLRLAARKGDRTALALALDEMRTLAFTPRHWARYLGLLRHPLARIADLLVIKQGDRIAHQKGWASPARRGTHRGTRRTSRRSRPARPVAAGPPHPRKRERQAPPDQPFLFPGL